MRWKCIDINNSCVIILKSTAHCTTVLKLNAKQKAFHTGTQLCKIWNMGEFCVSHWAFYKCKYPAAPAGACEPWGHSTERAPAVALLHLTDFVCPLSVLRCVMPTSVPSD